MEQYYYSPATGQTYSAYQMQALFGIDVSTTALSIINFQGFYPVQETSPNFDTQLYNPTFVWTIVSITGGEGAERTYTANAKPLPEAKENGSAEEKKRANSEESQIVTSSGLSTDLLTAVTGQDPLARPARFQVVLDAMAAVSDNLDSNLTAIDAATSVDEINNVVNPPSGVIYTGRGGSGGGPLDMNPSTMTDWNSVSMDVTDTELYIPSTTTTVLYNGALTPYTYAQTFAAFTPGNYTVQLRQTSTGLVIAEWECPDEAVNVPLDF